MHSVSFFLPERTRGGGGGYKRGGGGGGACEDLPLRKGGAEKV